MSEVCGHRIRGRRIITETGIGYGVATPPDERIGPGSWRSLAPRPRPTGPRKASEPMARRPAPTKAHPEPKSTKPATANEHPALMLFHALNALHTVCSNAGAFRELAERRERARAMQLNFLNIEAKIASDRANELARAGAPREQQWAALTEGMDRANDPPPSNEPAEYTKSLRENILDHGRTWCERARAAMRAGGAKGLDAATHPNAAGQARSIELHTKLRDAERVFDGLTIGVGDPRIIIDKDAASMADLGEWFARTRDEMGAVFETRGLDAPAPTPTVSVSPELLDRLQRAAAAVDPGAGDNGGAATKALPARTEVVLWEGAAHTDRNIRLARTRSAYLEAHGNVVAALAALKAGGNEIARRTFYYHLDALDVAIPGWRDCVQLCNEPAQMHGTRIVRTRGKSRGRVG